MKHQFTGAILSLVVGFVYGSVVILAGACEDNNACNFGMDERCYYCDYGLMCAATGGCCTDSDANGVCDQDQIQ
jgi:hypothetical protein